MQFDVTMTCPECGRDFDPLDAADAGELAYGHDCEVEPEDHRQEWTWQRDARL
jgi:hypothetical protein